MIIEYTKLYSYHTFGLLRIGGIDKCQSLTNVFVENKYHGIYIFMFLYLMLMMYLLECLVDILFQDVILNNDIKLDWMFKSSLISDICNVSLRTIYDSIFY